MPAPSVNWIEGGGNASVSTRRIVGNSEVLGLENAWIDIGKGFVLLPVLAFLHAGC